MMSWWDLKEDNYKNMARPTKEVEMFNRILTALERIEAKLSPSVHEVVPASQQAVAPSSAKVRGGFPMSGWDTSTLYFSLPPVEMRGGFPVPYEYQELVNTLLNKHFSIEINYLPDAASFEFSILVPQKYSNASASHWATYKEDRRTKVIQNVLGANGVREWVLKVYENFPTETKSAITYDRAQP